MKAVIVDDERLARVELRRLLRVHPEIDVVGEARTGNEAIALLRATAADVLFLDIQMPGMTGFDLLEEIEDVPQVIFTTAFDHYAIRAFEVNALDYLTKPIAPARLAAALARLRPRSSTTRLDQVFIRDGDRCWIVRLPDVFLLESEGNYTRMHFGGERPLIRRSLDSLEAALDSATFFRANRRQMINLRAIQKTSIVDSDILAVELRGGATVELSRRQAIRLRSLLRL
ncbi:MAG TPA: response regulator transcription factor [Vicinamibacterales bacterium]|jgi:two-component system LytT family response regulator|nr:response regulator transcription factor [Vicinamibacterales bacterium]